MTLSQKKSLHLWIKSDNAVDYVRIDRKESKLILYNEVRAILSRHGAELES